MLKHILVGLACLSMASAAFAQSPTPEADQARRIESLLGRMTLGEKIGQLNQVPGGRQRARPSPSRLNSRPSGSAIC